MRTDREDGNLHGITRQRSVRFVNGPTPRGRLRGRLSIRGDGNSITGGSEIIQPSTLDAQANQSHNGSRLSSPTGAKSRPTSQEEPALDAPSREAPPVPPRPLMSANDYLQSLLAIDKNYAFEDDAVSRHSSFRRLRRSKPTTTAPHFGRHSYVFLKDSGEVKTRASSSTLRYPSPDKDENSAGGPPLPLKTPKSMSFLRARRRLNISPTSLQLEGGGTPREGTWSFPEDHDTGHAHPPPRPYPVSSKPAIFFGSSTQRPLFNLRRSLRTRSADSSVSPLTAIPGGAAHGDEEPEPRPKPRKISQSLKLKIKKFFSLSKSDEDTAFPEQHIESHKTHAFFPDALQTPSSATDGSRHGEISVGNIPCEPPTIHAGEPHERHRSRRGSLETLDAEPQREVSDERSRITSWTNSAFSTVSSQPGQAWDGYPEPHLPVIEESGGRANFQRLGSGIRPRRS